MKKILKCRDITRKKMINIMKNGTLYAISISFILLMMSFATSVMGQTIAKFSVKDASLKEVLVKLEKATEIGFFYDSELVNEIKGITINEVNKSLSEILDKVFDNTNLRYDLIDNNIVIKIKKNEIKTTQKEVQQKKKHTFNVKVIDKNTKQPITGALVIVKGTAIGGICDAQGAVVLNNIESGAQLEITCVGMTMQTVTTSDKSLNLIISMEQDVMAVDDIIITGYQKISKERATGAFATVNPQKMESKLQPNLASILEGQISGLVTDKNGNIEIRGMSTLSAVSTPLIVLDGFPYDGTLESINSNNIENITVLKDGVAASIYGSRAANGVIVITSKSGKKGEFNVSYKGVFSTTLNSDFEDFNRGTTSDFIDAEIELYNFKPNSDETVYNSPVSQMLVEANKAGGKDSDYAKALANIDLLRGGNVFDDVEKYIQKTKISHTHNIGINGGTDKNLFNASINYKNEQGGTINNNSDRFILDIKNIWKPKEWLSFDIAANLNYTNSEESQTSWNDIMNSVTSLYPYQTIVDANGNPTTIDSKISPYLKEVYGGTSNMLPYSYNPIDELSNRMAYTNSLKARVAANINIKIAKGLSVTGGGTWSHTSSRWENIDYEDSFYVRNLVNGSTDKNNSITKYLPNGDIINQARNFSDSWTLRGQLNFNRDFNGSKHRVTAILGTEVRKDSYNNNQYATRVGYNKTAGSYEIMDIKAWNAGENNINMINESIFKMSNGQINLRDNRFVSYYGNGSYEYDSKYIISGSIRLDLTNFFGTDSKYRYKPLWSVGGTWKVSKEKFFDVEFINKLNVRASYGVNGNISLDEGPFLILGAGNYSDITGGTQYSIKSPPNGQLRWEKTASTNIGLDLTVLNNRLNFSVDYYDKLSSDLLAKDAIDPMTGFQSLTRNVGEISNRGVEISVSSPIISKDNFSWNARLNYSYNKNLISEYDVKRSIISSWTSSNGINAKGYPANAIFALPFAGLNDKGYSQGYDSEGNVQLLGNLKPEDVVYMGTTKAPHDLSFSTDVTAYNFNLSILVIAKFGGVFFRDAFHGSNYQNRHFTERWQEPGDEETTIYPRFEKQNTDMYTFPYTDVLVENSNYLKLRDITLSYSIPKNLLTRLGFSNVRVYAQARNLLTITAKGVDIDPESIGGISSGKSKDMTYNASFTSLPRKPEFYIGLSLNF